jgi:hypothetical protein
VVYAVPSYTTVVYVGTTPYYYASGTYYVATEAPAEQPPAEVAAAMTASTDSGENEHAEVESVEMTEGEDYNFEVVAPPVGATVPYLPDEAEEKKVGGTTYFAYDDTYYKAFVSEGETIYMVVEDPKQA